jgi:hypothetical protein
MTCNCGSFVQAHRSAPEKIADGKMVGAVRFEPGSGFSAVVARRWKGLSMFGLLRVGSFEAESYFHR